MAHAAPYAPFTADVLNGASEGELTFRLPDPEDQGISDYDFAQMIEAAWQVCDRFDLQTDIWRGRILKVVRDREKVGGDQGGRGFLKWLQEREISKSQAYALMELADSADLLLESGVLEPEDVNQFSKRAFMETAQSPPEVQQMVGDAAKKGDRITRREVRQLSDEWTAITSDLLPEEIKEKAANSIIPPRYIAPLVKEMEKLPPPHQKQLQQEVTLNPDVDTIKQATSEARFLAKYLDAATQVQALNREGMDLELALEEALRIGCLNATADLVNSAAQLEQTIAKLYGTWKKLNSLAERVYLDSGSSTPHLRSLLAFLTPLSGETLEIQIGEADSPLSRTIRLRILPETEGESLPTGESLPSDMEASSPVPSEVDQEEW
ncbi:hypothetical protein ACQ4M4_17490 [Leptolyngbya sp. AN02str]|uniref:hypothetical protein n=1 Tax=Leptolyngbya sp. AN02str TaxID=3423363 RepID=UPI003D31E532